MAEETKIAGEVLSDEQLDGVAGGTAWQSRRDKDFLQEIGAMAINSTVHEDKPADLERAWAQMGVTFIEYDGDGNSNQYFNNGAQISRMDALKLAAKKMKNKTINVFDYDV